jgi:hypothetical protein
MICSSLIKNNDHLEVDCPRAVIIAYETEIYGYFAGRMALALSKREFKLPTEQTKFC